MYQVASALLDFGPPIFLSLILRSMPADTVSPTSTPASTLENLRFYASLTLEPLLYAQTKMPRAATQQERTLQRTDAYFFAIAACACQLLKAQCELQDLYFSRRASSRVKAEVVASVYEKEMKRKDAVGRTTKARGKDRGKGKQKEEDGVKDEGEAADIGKIVSLVSADAEWIARFATFGFVRSFYQTRETISWYNLTNLFD